MIAREIACEEHHDVGDLPRFRARPNASPAARSSRRSGSETFSRKAVHGDARRNRIDVDAVFGGLDRRTPGECHHTRLCAA